MKKNNQWVWLITLTSPVSRGGEMVAHGSNQLPLLQFLQQLQSLIHNLQIQAGQQPMSVNMPSSSLVQVELPTGTSSSTSTDPVYSYRVILQRRVILW